MQQHSTMLHQQFRHQQESQQLAQQQQQHMQMAALGMHHAAGLAMQAAGIPGPGHDPTQLGADMMPEGMEEVEVGEDEDEDDEEVGGLLGDQHQHQHQQQGQATGLEGHGDMGLMGTQMLHPGLRAGGANQLTLSYQGEVYLFDSVPPEKVQAVLLLLGGRELPPGLGFPHMAAQYQKNLMMEFPQRLTMPQRMASLSRFREKRKERNFDKKIRYTVRKEVAQR